MRTFKLKKCNWVQGLHFTPEGELLALCGYESHGVETGVCLDLATGEPVRTFSFVAERFAFVPGQSRFALGSEVYGRSPIVQWCDPTTAPHDWQKVPVGVGRPRGTAALVAGALAVAPDASRMLVEVGRQRFRHPTTGEWTYHLAECPLNPPGRPTVIDLDAQIWALAFNPDGTRFVASLNHKPRPALRLFDRPGGEPLASFTHPVAVTNAFIPIAFSPDGSRFAAVNGRKIYLLRGEALEPHAILTGHAGQVNAIAFSPDSRRLLTASHDGQVRSWDAVTGEAGPAFDWKIGAVKALAFAPDGLTCAAGGKGGRVVLWDVDG